MLNDASVSIADVYCIIDLMKGKNSKLFGKLFKKFRLRAGFDTLPSFGNTLADRGYVFEDSTFSRWQNGSRVPQKREVVLSIIRVLVEKEGIDNLSDANALLEIAGHGFLTDSEVENIRPYLAYKLLPSEKEIEKIRKEINPLIQKWPYPVTVYDFTWRVVHENKANYKIFRSSKEQYDWIRKEKPTIFEIQFAKEAVHNKNFSKKELKEWHNFLLESLEQFKGAQRGRTKQKWYIDLIKKMMKNDLFRKLWKKAEAPEKKPLLKDYARITVPNPGNKGKILTFDLFSVPLIKDPRISLEFHTPADLETFKYFHPYSRVAVETLVSKNRSDRSAQKRHRNQRSKKRDL